MGGIQNSSSPQARIPQARDGYTPVQMYEKDGQYYQQTSPTPRKISPESAPKPTYTAINFGGGQQSGGRYGTPRKYGTPNSSYRAPATYRNTPAPSYGGGHGGKGGVSAPPPSYGGYGGGMSAPIYSHPLDNPMHGKFKAPDGSVVSHRGGVGLSPSVYSSPPPALRNYANQRSSSKGGVSPTPPRSSQLGNLAKANKSGAGAALGRNSPSKPKVPQNNIF